MNNDPFDQDKLSDSNSIFDNSAIAPMDEDSGNRRTTWMLLITALLGCACVFGIAFFIFQPNVKPLIAQYFPSPTITPSSTPIPTATVTPSETPSPTPTIDYTATADSINATSTIAAYQATVTSLPSQWKVAMKDSFDSNKYNWLVKKDSTDDYSTTTYEIKDGVYRWTSTAHKPYIGWVRTNKKQYSDIYISVDVREASGPNTADFGVVLREDDNSNFYYFGITNDGQYAFLVYNNDWITLQDWTFTDLIRTDEVNKITVLAQGSQFVFFINDQYLFDMTDDKIGKGQVGLAVELAQENDQAVFEFDNLLIQAPK